MAVVDGPVGRNRVRSFQLRMRGMSWIPRRWANPNTGVLWPWVSAWRDVELDVGRILQEASQNVDRFPYPQGIKWLNRAM